MLRANCCLPPIWSRHMGTTRSARCVTLCSVFKGDFTFFVSVCQIVIVSWVWSETAYTERWRWWPLLLKRPKTTNQSLNFSLSICFARPMGSVINFNRQTYCSLLKCADLIIDFVINKVQTVSFVLNLLCIDLEQFVKMCVTILQ